MVAGSPLYGRAMTADDLINAILDTDELIDRAYRAAIEHRMPDVADELLLAKQKLAAAMHRLMRRPIAVGAVLS
jgi:hypothetical protein